jgi:hypothetical protein
MAGRKRGGIGKRLESKQWPGPKENNLRSNEADRREGGGNGKGRGWKGKRGINPREGE